MNHSSSNQKVMSLKESLPTSTNPFDVFRYSTILASWLTHPDSIGNEIEYGYMEYGYDETFQYKQTIDQNKQIVQSTVRAEEPSQEGMGFGLAVLVDHADFDFGERGYEHSQDRTYCKKMIELCSQFDEYIAGKNGQELAAEKALEYTRSSLDNIQATIALIESDKNNSRRAILRPLRTIQSRLENNLTLIQGKELEAQKKLWFDAIETIPQDKRLTPEQRINQLSVLWQEVVNFEVSTPSLKKESDNIKKLAEEGIQKALLTSLVDVLQDLQNQAGIHNKSIAKLQAQIQSFTNKTNPSDSDYKKLKENITRVFSGQTLDNAPVHFIDYLFYLLQNLIPQLRSSANLTTSTNPITFRGQARIQSISQALEPKKKQRPQSYSF